jgi:hypothetical protein
LKRFDALSVADVIGKRSDGQIDRNAAAQVQGGFNFLIAHGAVRAIEEILRGSNLFSNT